MNLLDRAKAIWKLFSGGKLTKTDKWILALGILYCLSPVDIIPDFLPVVGFLDDLLVVLMGLRHFSKRATTEENPLISVDATVVNDGAA